MGCIAAFHESTENYIMQQYVSLLSKVSMKPWENAYREFWWYLSVELNLSFCCKYSKCKYYHNSLSEVIETA